MRRFLVALGVSLAAAAVFAEDLARPPVYFALSVSSLDASIAWYEQKLGLSATRLSGSGPAKVAILKGDGLLIELVEHPKAFDLKSRVPDAQGAYSVHGIFKVGFFVKDLDATVEALRKRGARFKGDTYTDEKLKVRAALVLDNDDNVIQLFEAFR